MRWNRKSMTIACRSIALGVLLIGLLSCQRRSFHGSITVTTSPDGVLSFITSSPVRGEPLDIGFIVSHEHRAQVDLAYSGEGVLRVTQAGNLEVETADKTGWLFRVRDSETSLNDAMIRTVRVRSLITYPMRNDHGLKKLSSHQEFVARYQSGARCPLVHSSSTGATY